MRLATLRLATLRLAICNCVCLIAVIGCASRPEAPPAKVAESSPSSPTTQPILYHRTGGIAGTDDRVIIWPDGFVDVRGRLLPENTSRLDSDRHGQLRSMFDGWQRLDDTYLTTTHPDAYTITIDYGGKSVAASDLAPNLPETFRRIFTEIESIAAQTAASPRLAP